MAYLFAVLAVVTWVVICLTCYWGEWGKALLVAAGVGALIAVRIRQSPAVPLRVDLTINLILSAVVAAGILFFQIGSQPLLSAVLIVVFFVSVSLSRWRRQ